MATLQSGKCFTVPTFFGMCCRSEWQERMYIYKWHEVDQTKHEIFCVHIVCNEIQVKVNLEITTFFFYLRFPYCPNFFWFGVVVWLTCAVFSPGRGCGSAAPPGAVWCPADRLSVSGISSSAAAPRAAPLHCPPAGLSAKHTDSQWVYTGGSVHPVCVLSRCMTFS